MTTQTLSFPDMSEMHTHAKAAAELLKQMSNEHRLMILCALGNQELAVSELNHLVPLTVYYRLNGDAALRIIAVLQSLYCPEYQTSSCGENS